MSCNNIPSAKDTQIIVEASLKCGIKTLAKSVEDIRNILNLLKINGKGNDSVAKWANKQTKDTERALTKVKEATKKELENLARKEIDKTVKILENDEAPQAKNDQTIVPPEMGGHKQQGEAEAYLKACYEDVSLLLTDAIQKVVCTNETYIHQLANNNPSTEGTYIHTRIMKPAVEAFMTEYLGFDEGKDAEYKLAKPGEKAIDISFNIFDVNTDLKPYKKMEGFGPYKAQMSRYHKEAEAVRPGILTTLWYYYLLKEGA